LKLPGSIYFPPILEAKMALTLKDYPKTVPMVGLLKTKNHFLRRGVANDILGLLLKSKEQEDLERRIEALERAMKEKRP